MASKVEANVTVEKDEQTQAIDLFVLKAIPALRTKGYKGIHVVYSQFNTVFKETFPGRDPRVETERMQAEGLIEIGFARGGAMIYLAGEKPESTNKKAAEAREKILAALKGK